MKKLESFYNKVSSIYDLKDVHLSPVAVPLDSNNSSSIRTDTPNPMQPSILYMEASLPQNILESNKLTVNHVSGDARLRNILPPPSITNRSRSTSIGSESSTRSLMLFLGDEEDDDSSCSTSNSSKHTPFHLDDHQIDNSVKNIPISTSARVLNNLSKAGMSISLNNHTKSYNCTFCQKTFLRPSSLKIHLYSHTGEKPFNCSFPGCRRRFSVQSNMKRHLRVHFS